MLVVNSRISIPASELQWTFARSSGPGGQNVNKVSSKAVLRWSFRNSAALPAEVRARFLARYGNRLTGDGDLLVSSQRYRDQGRNIDDVREKLQSMILAVAVAPRKRRATKPTRASVTRRIESKQARSRTKRQRRSVNDE